jgi:hypothetical protein
MSERFERMNISRRSLFSLFAGGASIAAVGKVKVDPPLIEASTTDPSHTHDLLPKVKSLSTIRDMLYPGLWTVTKDPDYEADISVNYVYDCLHVGVYRFSTRRFLAFEITRESIDQGRYKAEFHPNLLKVFEALANES